MEYVNLHLQFSNSLKMPRKNAEVSPPQQSPVSTLSRCYPQIFKSVFLKLLLSANRQYFICLNLARVAEVTFRNCQGILCFRLLPGGMLCFIPTKDASHSESCRCLALQACCLFEKTTTEIRLTSPHLGDRRSV